MFHSQLFMDLVGVDVSLVCHAPPSTKARLGYWGGCTYTEAMSVMVFGVVAHRLEEVA